MIYAQTFSISATTCVELFTQLGIDPVRCEVFVQVIGSSTSPQIYLAQDSAAANIGIALASEGLSASGGSETSCTSRFLADKDDVYLFNATGSAVTVRVAVTDHP